MMMSKTWNTSWPSQLKNFGCSVVLQTRWRMVVFPALARPMIRTRKRGLCVRRFCACLCCLSISSALWNSVLERDICCWDAWDDGWWWTVMKNQDRHGEGEQCFVWLHVSQTSDVTHLLPINFPLFRLTHMEFSTYISRPPTELW